MKKIAIILLLIFAFASIFGTVCLAAESELAEDTAEIVEDAEVIDAPTDSTDESTNESVEELTSESNDVFTRLWEFVTKYKGEVLSIVGDTGILTTVAVIIFKIKGNKKISEKSLNEIKELLNASVNVLNDMVDGYNVLTKEHEKLKETYDKYQADEAERNKAVSAMAIELTAILNILSEVYVNNSKLPQGIREIVGVTYAKCLKTIENDEALASVVKSAQAVISDK